MLSWRRRRTTTKNISPCKPIPIFQPTHIGTELHENIEDEESEFARCLHATSSSGYPSMSTGSLRSILPKTPSPICSDDSSLTHDDSETSSSSSSVSDVFYSEIATEFSSQQSICSLSDTSKLSSRRLCSKLVPEKVSYQTETETMNKNMDLKSCMAASSVCDSTFETDHCTKLHPDEINTEGSDDESPTDSRHKLMRRPKPYQAFLDEVNKQKLEAQIDRSKQAKQTKLMNMMRRKEAAISEWEHKKTTEAMKEMRKLENKLERRRAKALKSTQEKINSVKQAAGKKMARAKRVAEFKEFRNTKTERGMKYPLWCKLCG